MLAGHLALTRAALFTGAAVYVNIAEQLVRLQPYGSSLLAATDDRISTRVDLDSRD